MKVRDILKDCSEWKPGADYNVGSPVVSVLLPTFRRAKSGLFERAVRSVLNQDLRNIELIIIDDASTDGTADLIEFFMRSDPRVSCIRHKYNVGLPAISEYEGFVKARGEYIAFIFDDNEWERNYLDNTIRFMIHNHAKAAYGRMHSYFGKEENEYYELGVATWKMGLQSLDVMNYIANGAVVLAKEVLNDKRVGLYDPHVTMTRVCDWGLWKKLVRYYEFFETGILAGKELGVTQKDSIGNTYKKSTWTIAEREREVMLGELAPENFLEVEINKSSEENTDFYQNAVRDFYRNFSNKKWFQEEEEQADNKLTKLRILVLARCYDATLYLSFLRLLYLGQDFIFRFGDDNTSLDEVALADAVILARDLTVLEKYKNICLKIKIPCYYYIDDNFIELYKDNKEDAYLGKMKALLEPSRVRMFEGIFTSTSCLADYFIENRLNSNVFTLEPCIDIENIFKPKMIKSNYFTIAFMGGAFRSETFRRVVMLALVKLSEKYSIRVVYPEEINLKLFMDIKNLELIGIKRDISLDLILKHYSKYEPDILIHCGPDIKNNIYKTLNALINAVQLGAVLITSDSAPYSENELRNKAYLCVKNYSSNWIKALDDLLSDARLREKMYNCAAEYCLQRFSSQKGEAILHKAFSGITPLSNYETIRRLNDVIFDLEYVHTLDKNTDDIAVEGKVSRSLNEASLGFTGGIVESKKYYIQCKVDVFSELGICFASLGEPIGCVRIGIWCKEGQLRECVLDMEEFVHDNWTYVSFKPIENAKNQVFSISLNFEYDKDSALMGVFEDASKNTFITRLANKLGYPMKKLDVLYVDCR